MAGVVRRDGLREAVTALRDEWGRRVGGKAGAGPKLIDCVGELSRVLDAVPDVPPKPPATAEQWSEPVTTACGLGHHEQCSGTGARPEARIVTYRCACPCHRDADPDTPAANRTIGSVTDHDATPTGPAMIPPTADAVPDVPPTEDDWREANRYYEDDPGLLPDVPPATPLADHIKAGMLRGRVRLSDVPPDPPAAEVSE